MQLISRKHLILLGCLATLAACTPKTPDEHSIETSLADLKVYDGLEVTLFASEPMFTNPTNLAIDDRGRIWVSEAYNYRNQLNPNNPERKEGDRIMILEDTDGDGKADKSKVFYQGTDVNAALGISLLGNKVIISCSPNVFVFTDENGDDVPETKEVFFKGVQGVQHDHGMHSFIFAPDGKLYFNFGNEGKSLLTAAGDTVVDVRGRKVVTNGRPFREGLVMRCDVDGKNVEVLAHNFRNNYEVTIDPFGTLWQSDNDDDGNKGTRINYVMEGGNFGYKDEMTGASWPTRRTNLEKEIPLRHWHLNDPGVVPNLLQTGSGSPAGITIYEGTLLPEVFRGQMIHAEPGHNVVRSYPIENSGAGYMATIVNILESKKDQWFRPADVAIAPDGSLFIADWYDPGVGGHAMGDPDRGRIYRVAPSKLKYIIEKTDVTSVEGAINALLNPNPATRYRGWTSLSAMGEKAESALTQLWKSDNQLQRAQALWLLAKLPKGETYLNEGLSDANSNIVIAALRNSRASGKDIIPVVEKLVSHSSPQVRREAILALRGNNSPKAAELWADLALQHDGKDRWYLEALGIGAIGNEELYFAAWKKKAGNNWNTHSGHDIIWRSRSKEAMPLLAEMIKSSDEVGMLWSFRAFDFHKDPSKQAVLSKLVTQTQGEKVMFALKHMDASNTTLTPAVRTALNKTLDQYKDHLEFVELVSRFKLENRTPDLLSVSLHYPDSAMGKEAMKTLLEWNKTELIQKVISEKKKEDVQAVIKSIQPIMYDKKAMLLMELIFMDSTQNIDNRKLALRALGGPTNSEDHLLKLASENKIPPELHITAAGVFQSAWRPNIRAEGAKYFELPGSKDGGPLTNISVLMDKTGIIENGKIVFTNTCSNCHQVNGVGVKFGPDLSEIGSKLSKRALYTSILFPDQGISFGYEGYTFKMKDGSQAYGMITSETKDKVEIRYITTQQTLIPNNIVSREKQETSLMPSNLQTLMTEQELVDLVEYLQSLRNNTVSMQ
ncbi:MAG: PVC-type heme-binding CxxCH protein [Bacteroidota bacterium]